MGKREQNKQELSQRILEAAFIEFANNGYTSTKLSNIASSAKVANGLINKYFISKENLLCEIIRLGSINKYFFSNNEITVKEALNYIIDKVREAALSNNDHYKFDKLLVFSNDLPETVSKCIRDCINNSCLYSIVKESIDRKELPNIDPSDIIIQLYKTTVFLISRSIEIGLDIPNNLSILQAVGYRESMDILKQLVDYKSITKGLLDNFSVVFYVDLDKDVYQVVKDNADIILDENIMGKDYYGYLTSLVKEHIIKCDQETIFFGLKKDMIISQLLDENCYYLEGRSKSNDGIRYYQGRITKATNKCYGHQILICVSNVTNIYNNFI